MHEPICKTFRGSVVEIAEVKTLAALDKIEGKRDSNSSNLLWKVI